MNEFTQSLQDSMFIASIFIAALFIICTVSLALRNYEIRHELNKLKKWRKFSEIEKKQKHEEYDRLATELAEERAFNENQGDMHVRLMLNYSSENEANVKIRAEVEELSAERYRLACENTDLKQELKIAKTCLKVAETEITELKAKLERKRNDKGQFAKKQERDWTTATKDELLDEAKRRYPIGTKFICIEFNDKRTVTDNNYWDNEIWDNEIWDNEIWFGVEFPVSGVVYKKGKWAQILPA